MASDGKLIFDTKIDESGFKSGIGKLKGLATKTGKIAAGAIAAVGTAMTAAGTAAVKIGSDFEAGMSQVAATMGMTREEIQGGSEEFKKLESAARQMGATTQFSATQASEALNYIALAGYDADDAIKLLPKTLNLAAAGGLELGYATDIVTDAMSALGLEIKDADSFIDQMAKTSQKSNTNVGQLGEAILTVGGTAKDLAGGTVELNTALGILANNGIKGAEGGTKLRNVIMSLTAPTNTAGKAMDALGISAFDAEGNMRPLQDVFKDINLEMANMTTQEKKGWLNTVFNKQDLAAVSGLLAANAIGIDDISTALQAAGGPGEEFRKNIIALAQDFDQFSDKQDFVNHTMKAFGLTAEQAGILYEGLKSSLEGSSWEQLAAEIENSKGAAEEMSKVMIDNLQGDIKILKSALEELAISFYKTFDTDLRGTVEKATGVLEGLSLAFRGIDVENLKTSLEESGLSVDKFNISLVDASFAVEQFSDKAEFVKYAMEQWGLSSEQAGILFDGLVNSMESSISPIELLGKTIGTFLADALTEIAGQIPKFIDVGVSVIQNLVEGLRNNLPQLAETGLNIIESLISGILQVIVEVGTLGFEIISALMEGITGSLPELLESGSEMILELAQGISDNLPEFTGKAVDLILALVEGLVAALPNLATAALEIVVGLAKSIIENAPKLIEAIPKLIETLVSGLIENAPNLLKAGLELCLSIIKGIISGIPQLLLLGPKIVIGLAKGIVEGVSGLFEAGGKLIGNLVSGISGRRGDTKNAGSDVAGATVEGFNSVADNASNAGTDITSKYAEGIILGKDLAISATEDIGTNVAENLNKTEQASESGKSIGEAFSKGIADNKSSVDTSAKSLSDAVKSGLDKGKLEIGRVGSDTGKEYTSKTLDKKSDAQKSGTELGKAVVKGASEASKEMAKAGETAGSEFVKGINSKSADATNVGSEISKSLAKGIDAEKSSVNNSVNKLIQDAINTIQNKRNEFQQKGQELIKELIKGFENTRNQIQQSIRTILTNTITSANQLKSQFTSIGRNLGQGIAQGISSSSGAIQAAARNAVRNAVNAAKRAGQIRSPSRVMRNQVGYYLSAGMAEGIKDGEGLVKDANKELVNGMEKQYKQLIDRGANENVLKNYLSKNITEAFEYGNLLISQSDLDFENYNKNFSFKEKILDEIKASKNLINDSFNNMQFKLNAAFLSPTIGNINSNNNRPIEISIYGADFGNRGQARDFGRELYSEIERERRRYGG